MSVELYSGKKFLGPFSTNTGLAEASDAVIKLGGSALKELFTKGTTYDIDGLKKELGVLTTSPQIPKSVLKTLVNFQSMLSKVKSKEGVTLVH